uniref:DnaJ homolog subfamily C member 11 (Trinotate prediction) n=1 Tax=Henneguya salminicola TaxID=69463 RepID=A0A6G3MGZ8_HENSL
MSHNIPIKNIVPFTIISLIAYNSWEAYCSPHEYKRFFYKLRNIFQPSKDLNYNRLVYSKQIELLKVDALRNMQIEKQRNGLVIIRAFYGSYESVLNNDFINNSVINVTIPIQTFVNRSKLKLSQYSKSGLLGFFDPCPENCKILMIEYEFNNLLHRIYAEDQRPTILPSKNHLVNI